MPQILTTTGRQPETNQHDYNMVSMERRNISGTIIHTTKDEGGKMGYDTPRRKMYGAVFPSYEGARKEEWGGDGRFDEKVDLQEQRTPIRRGP